jgi:outer membrane protein assembly factor BamD
MRVYRGWFLFFFVAIVFVSSCATIDEDTSTWSAKKIYLSAQKSLKEGDFIKAIEYFENLESKYPFGEYTKQARLEIAYSHYKQQQYEEAQDAIEYFISLYPRHKNISYALYLKGLILFKKDRGIMESIFPRNFANIDEDFLLTTYQTFALIVKEHKDSIYAEDSKKRMIFLKNKLAELEYKAATYYQKRGAVIASINRLKYLLNIYPNTLWQKPALQMMQKNYDDLKLKKMSKITEELYNKRQ